MLGFGHCDSVRFVDEKERVPFRREEVMLMLG